VRALSRNAGLLPGFRLLGSRLSGGFFGSCIHMISFGGDYRDHMNCSGPLKMQVNCGENRDRRRVGDGAFAGCQMVSDGIRW
jgi:hypothetical protein